MDGDGGWMFGLGPLGVDAAFDVPFGHFAFEHSRCCAVTAGRDEAVEQAA